MRIASVSPRVTTPRVGGSQNRIGSILRHLAERNEVRQFSQPRLHELRMRLPEPAFERINRSLPAALFSEIGEHAWPTAPILAGAALKLTPLARLRRLLGWADVTLVEFPWQFEECARATN